MAASVDANATSSEYSVILSTSGVIRIQANTRVHLKLRHEGSLEIRQVTGNLPLKGKADNLKTPFAAQLIWLLKRSESDPIEEIPHNFPVEVTPSDTAGRLKDKDFTIVQVESFKKDDGTMSTRRKPLGWNILAIGLVGRARVGFLLKPVPTFVDEAALDPAGSGVSLAVPLEVRISPSSSLRVGSKISIAVDSRAGDGDMRDLLGEKVRLRVWAGSLDYIPTSGLGYCVEWKLENAIHTESILLGVEAGRLWYRLDGTLNLQFNFALTHVVQQKNATNVVEWVDAPAPLRKGVIAKPSAPKLQSWSLVHTSAESRTFRASGKITGFDRAYMPPLAITLRCYRRSADGSPDSFHALVSGTRAGELHLPGHDPDRRAAGSGEGNPDAGASLCSEANPDAEQSTDAQPNEGSPDTTAQAQPMEDVHEGTFIQDFVVDTVDTASLSGALSKDAASTLLFATLRIATPANVRQPFVELVSYTPNLMGSDKDDSGFAPFEGNDLATPESGTEVCTDGVNYTVPHIELESPGIGTTLLGPEHGGDWGNLSWSECMMDFIPVEGFVRWLYKDHKGLITVGIGVLIRNEINFQADNPLDMAKREELRRNPDKGGTTAAGLMKAVSLPFYNLQTGAEATAREVTEAFMRVHKMDGKQRAENYKDPVVYMPSAEVIRLFRAHLEMSYKLNGDSVSGPVSSIFPEFADYPKAAKRGIIDMIYAFGPGGLVSKRGPFVDACKHREWMKAGPASRIADGQPKRNEWRTKLFDYAQQVEQRKAGTSGGSSTGESHS